MNEVKVTYEKINRYIHNLWIRESQGSEYFIAIYDNDVHKQVLQNFDINENKFIDITNKYGGYYWRGFTQYEYGIPQVFGIISLQILAINRHEGNSPRYAIHRLLNISEENINQAFGYSQHKIWELLKKVIVMRSFKSNILKTIGPHCFVKYPKSQCYLRKSDLERMQEYFHSFLGLNKSLNLRFRDFVNEARLNRPDLYKKYLTPFGYQKIVSDDYNNEVMYRQLYRHFCSQEFQIVSDKPIKIESTKLIYQEKRGFYFVTSSGKEQELRTQTLIEPLIKAGYRRYNHILLSYNQQWAEYEEVKIVDHENKLLILFLDKNISLAASIRTKYSSRDEKGLQIFSIDDSTELFKICPELFSKQRSGLDQVAGVKVSRAAYLYGYGPQYSVNGSHNIYLNNLLIKDIIKNKYLNLSMLDKGHYVLEVIDEPKVTFDIVDRSELVLPLELYSGIELEYLRTNGADMIGQQINNKTVDVDITKEFIKLSTNVRTSRLISSNLILQNLKRQIG